MAMNKDLQEAITLYATAPHVTLLESFVKKSKDNLMSMLSDLITLYINDKNSSTLREFITVTVSGYTHSARKIGYDGYTQTSIDKPLYCEAKPKNFDSAQIENYKKGLRKSSPEKLCGSGNFTDYTWKRFDEDTRANLHMLVAGFVDGRLIYILEFLLIRLLCWTNWRRNLKRHFLVGMCQEDT